MNANKKHVPGLVYWPQGESFEEARERYRRQHGFDLPPDGHVVQLVAVDSSRGGNNRELSPQEFKEACAG
ncbi:hypothetical protein [Nitrosomonas communis]|uniref:hypothetical protein n=1 Tax=Nitrosomonas communis TaxID=44574 RepID=UPI0026EF210A|nr:hypothetical protein [Nitrosomonas communis]MCO6426989.1 hypothetical protein [Nitrosomonas communis]